MQLELQRNCNIGWIFIIFQQLRLDLFSKENACGSNLVASDKNLHFKCSLTGGLNVLKTTYQHI